MRILIADDETHIRAYLRLVLISLGHSNIQFAANGQEAIDKFNEWKPDVLLLDINMPVKTGFEVLQNIRELNEECRIVMLTSAVNRESVHKAIKAGADAYIRKDLPREQLAKLLSEQITAIQ